MSEANKISEPPVKPIPNERVAKSAMVVEATMTDQ
jgi:hypothetical protein